MIPMDHHPNTFMILLFQFSWTPSRRPVASPVLLLNGTYSIWGSCYCQANPQDWQGQAHHDLTDSTGQHTMSHLQI